jgi:hypothetical protein
MTHRILTLAALAVALAGGLALASPAAARTNVAVGLGDQSEAMFASPAYQQLNLRKTRYFIRWDAMRDTFQRANAERYVAAAGAAGVRVFMHVSTNDFRAKRAELPSVKRYRREVGRLVRHFRARGVTEWGVWNEANHNTQPTWDNPKRAADYFRQMRAICKGCTIVALDVLDQPGVERYIRRFYAALPASQRKYAKIVGIHNYSDTNRKRSSGTRDIIREVKRRDATRTQFWLTETGGVVEFGSSFQCSERRAASRVTYMFSLARKYRRDIKRLYAYNWHGTDCTTRFDTGLVRLDGSTRPAYETFRRGLQDFAR